MEVEIRKLKTSDSIESLTQMIHRSYKELEELGLRYWGSYQTVEDTNLRISKGDCFVATVSGKIRGTIILSHIGSKYNNEWFDRDDVVSIHQLAVEPEYQKKGICSAMLSFIEKQAKGLRVSELACDTSKKAIHLIAMFESRGFREVMKVNWDVTNYDSVILSKELA